jgi:phytoene synthase
LPAGDDLDSSVRRSDPERWLASRFVVDPLARSDVVALLAFEHELDRAVRVTSNPLLSEIRLTWWRESLDEIFSGSAVRRHPVAWALSEAARRRELPRALLEAMIEARIAPPAQPREWADAVAAPAMLLSAMTLDPRVEASAVTSAGRVWGLLSLKRRGNTEIVLETALAEAARAARRVSITAFPAIACATLARAPHASPLEVRARLFWCILRGRL